MADVITDDGRDVVEEIATGADITVDEVAVGTSTSSPSTSDTSMDDEVYSADSSEDSVTVEKTSSVGVLRYTISMTGGTEVPSDSDITEFGIKASDGRLFYHETRSDEIDVASGETKTVEILINLKDDETDSGIAITDVGLDEIANMLIGDSSEVIDTIAIGSSTNEDGVDSDDTSMFDEVHRASDSESHVTVESTSNTGEIDARISVSAGPDTDDEVDGGTDISEFGILTDNDTLILHEIRTTVELETDDTKTFDIPFTVIQ